MSKFLKKIFILCLFLFFVVSSQAFARGISKNGVISESCYKISGIYPSKFEINATNSFPGYRGPNQLIVYKPAWGLRTGTNEFGKEAVVINGIVVQLTGADSIIPKNGYVISGHGNAKTWLNKNIKIGTRVEINEKNNTIKAITTVDSYEFNAEAKIKEVEAIIKKSNEQNLVFNEKKVREYLRDAKKYLRKGRFGNDKSALSNLNQSIKASSNALKYTLPYVSGELHGVWIRPTEKTRDEIIATLDNLSAVGINTIFLETYFHGKTIFPSKTMEKYGFNKLNPIFGDTDILAIYLKEAHKRNIKVNIWFESFYIGNVAPSSDLKNILSVKPHWGNKNKINADSKEPTWHPTEHRGYFLDPANPEVVLFLQELIEEISARYAIDGFNIDYIRYPQAQKPNEQGYEMSNWGYTQVARDEFKEIYGIDPIEISYKTPLWQKWDEYRQNKITDYIKSVSEILENREILLSAVIFPDEDMSKSAKQQNWSKWSELGYVNALTPLILTSDDELAKKMMREVKRKSNGIAVYPGAFVGFMEGEPEDLLRQIRSMRELNLGGIILFDYAHLDKKYMDYLQSCVFSAVCE